MRTPIATEKGVARVVEPQSELKTSCLRSRHGKPRGEQRLDRAKESQENGQPVTGNREVLYFPDLVDVTASAKLRRALPPDQRVLVRCVRYLILCKRLQKNPATVRLTYT
jgi:hypothetical protein